MIAGKLQGAKVEGNERCVGAGSSSSSKMVRAKAPFRGWGWLLGGFVQMVRKEGYECQAVTQCTGRQCVEKVPRLTQMACAGRWSGPVDHLITQGCDAEQIWAQLMLAQVSVAHPPLSPHACSGLPCTHLFE